MFKLLKYLKGPAIFYAILGPCLMMLEVAMDLTLPTLLSNIVDIGIANREKRHTRCNPVTWSSDVCSSDLDNDFMS